MRITAAELNTKVTEVEAFLKDDADYTFFKDYWKDNFTIAVNKHTKGIDLAGCRWSKLIVSNPIEVLKFIITLAEDILEHPVADKTRLIAQNVKTFYFCLCLLDTVSKNIVNKMFKVDGKTVKLDTRSIITDRMYISVVPMSIGSAIVHYYFYIKVDQQPFIFDIQDFNAASIFSLSRNLNSLKLTLAVSNSKGISKDIVPDDLTKQFIEATIKEAVIKNS